MSTPPRVCQHFFAEHTSRYDLRCTRCGISSLDAEAGDLRMVELWEQWARATGNAGAGELFKRIAYRLKRVPAPPPETNPSSIRLLDRPVPTPNYSLGCSDEPRVTIITCALVDARVQEPDATNNFARIAQYVDHYLTLGESSFRPTPEAPQ